MNGVTQGDIELSPMASSHWKAMIERNNCEGMNISSGLGRVKNFGTFDSDSNFLM